MSCLSPPLLLIPPFLTQAPPKEVPKTIENQRVYDETTVDPEDEEVRFHLAGFYLIKSGVDCKDVFVILLFFSLLLPGCL